MIVSWNTYSKLDRPTVSFGEHPNQLYRQAFSDISITYPTSTTYNNHVKLDGLQPNTLYYYLPEYSNATTPYTFRTSREAGDKTPFSVAYVADLGTMGPDGLTTHVGTGAANPLQPGETNTIQSLADFQSDYDFVWHGKTFLESRGLLYADTNPQPVTLPTPITGSRKNSKASFPIQPLKKERLYTSES